MIYMFIYYFFLVSLILFFLFMYVYINNLSLYVELLIFDFSSMKIEILILIDWISLLFSSVVLFISLMVIFYSLEYMYGDLMINRFIMLIMMFILSMMFLIYMPNMISILLGWDGLGLVSYSLVIYYQGKNSFNSGMITVLMNRLGDILILMVITLMIMLGSWNFMFFKNINFFMYLLMMLAAFTKSAQIPFSSWLPLAMAAPTPVSSLVHSSTLVTAGVYLLIRLNYLLDDIFLINFMMLISVITMFLAGLGANFEFDLKKIIALSTLSQLGVMIFSLCFNLMQISLFHLLMHALFKSMLFMCGGVIIHNMLFNQDIRKISGVMINMPLVSLMFNCSTMSLCGVPFLSGFYSKDLILDMFLMNQFNKLILILLFISMGFTLMYSIRLIYYSFIKIPQLNVYFKLSLISQMSLSMYMLFFFSVYGGVLLSWILFSMKNMVYLPLMFKLMIYFFMMIGGWISYYFMNNFFSLYMIKYCNIYLKYFMTLWFMPMLYNYLVPKLLFLSSGSNFYLDYGWLEYLGIEGLKLLIFKLFNIECSNKSYYLYLVIMFMLMMIFLIF